VKTVWKPNVTAKLGEATAETIIKLIAVLEDDDDVQAVFSNFEVDEAVLAKLTAA
jgi:transcriptional/translational regulatory protein YebC/TACO1